MSRFSRLLQRLFIVRWLRTLIEFARGARVSPSAAVVGGLSRIRLGRGVYVGPRSQLVSVEDGRIHLSTGCWLASDVIIETTRSVGIGAGTTVQRGVSIHGEVRIGNGCLFAPHVYLSSRSHAFRHVPHLPIREQDRLQSENGVRDRPIWIQDDCWLGVNVVIGPGVTVGKGAVVGANSVVLEDVAPYTVVAGSPARKVGERLEWRPPVSVDATDARHCIYLLCSEPLMVAVARTRQVSVHVFAREPLRIRAGAVEHDVPAGESVITLPVVPMKGCEIASLLVMEVLPPAPVSALLLRKVSALESGGEQP